MVGGPSRRPHRDRARPPHLAGAGGRPDAPRSRRRPTGRCPTSTARRALSEAESLTLLAGAGVPVVVAIPAVDPDAARAAAAALGAGPFVVKLDAVDLAHKSDIGGVRLGLPAPDQVAVAAGELIELGRDAGLDVRGVLVEPMLPPGVELIVGSTRDALFGPAVVVGLGGVLAEILDDVAIRIAPISRSTALDMLASLRGAPLLDGARGGPSVDHGALADLVVAVARLCWERPDIVAIDLNPVVATTDGAIAVDALVVLDGVRGV